MYRIFFAIVFMVGAGILSASAQDQYCFKKDTPKLPQTVSFLVEQGNVDGTFVIGSGDGETFEFTGTKIKNRLTVKFKGKIPYNVPPGTHDVVWTLGPKRTLGIPMYGKDRTTGKYSTFTSVYTSTCRDL